MHAIKFKLVVMHTITNRKSGRTRTMRARPMANKTSGRRANKMSGRRAMRARPTCTQI